MATSINQVVSFRGIPYKAIIDRLLLKMGYDGDPAEGERNTALYALTRELRYICEFNAQTLFDVLPHWGLPDGEVESTIQSALNTVRKGEIPDGLKRIITSLEDENRMESVNNEEKEDWQRLPLKLPRLLQLILKHYPEEYHPAVVMSAITILGTILTRVRSEYIDGAIHSQSFLTCIVGHQARVSYASSMRYLLNLSSVQMRIPAVFSRSSRSRRRLIRTQRYNL